jgi:pimeloyl-ACP methyl ester carboxylesterase
MTRHPTPTIARLTGAVGNVLVADVFGQDLLGKSGAPVLLLHGGGQTRHAWKATAEKLARAGHTAYALDQRGHGDSDWVETGDYSFLDFASDAAAVAEQLTARSGGLRPVTIGASLGGIASLLAQGEAQKRQAHLFGAIVLVDITPRVELSGVAKVQGFMRTHAQDGFATIDEAADAVAEYLPHRPRPKSNEGLRKNLRQRPDGRWRWHWDPRFLDGRSPVGAHREAIEAAMLAAAAGLKIPALLVRGGASELVQEAHAREFLALVPHAEYADVAGARHMVAGDRNDQFGQAILDFVGRL